MSHGRRKVCGDAFDITGFSKVYTDCSLYIGTPVSYHSLVLSAHIRMDKETSYYIFMAFTLAGSSANVGNETSAAGMRLGRAHLTWVTPGPSNGGTTHGLGTDDPTELALAHLVIYLAKAGTGTIV